MVAQTLKLGGREYIVLERKKYEQLMRRGEAGNRPGVRSSDARRLPLLPESDTRGLRPARETLRAILARDIIKDRVALGWSQRELARRAAIRPETLCRIEAGNHTPTVATIERIDRALRNGGSGHAPNPRS